MKKVTVAGLLLLGSVFLAGCGQHQTVQMQTVDPSVETQLTEEATSELLYKNAEYGFEFLFDEGYRNIWGLSNENNSSDDALDSFHFIIKDAPNPPIFEIYVYDKSWWLKNTTVDSDKSAWRQGAEHSLPNAFGIYLGTSDKYVYALSPNNQSCPDLSESGPGPLCKITYSKTEMVMNSFKITDK